MINHKIAFLSIFLLFSVLISSINTDSTVRSISDSVSGDSNYLKADFQIETEEDSFYFKYSVSTTPSSRIGAFRFDLDQVQTAPEILCKFVSDSATDTQIINELEALDVDKSVCVGAFNSNTRIFDGIFKHDTTLKILAIILKKKGSEVTNDAHVYVRGKENVLEAKEQNVQDNSLYSLIPYTLVISDFRSSASRILFYSRTRDMQMYYVEGDKPYPERLFFGNIMSVYTNPAMVRQKYKNANTMILIPRDFSQEEPMGEKFLYQIKLFPSDFTLDYYMGINQSGREKNTPLVINMTQCVDPYYVIVNYNVPEASCNLHIDEIYGKLKSLSVAPTFTQINWDDMIVKDMKEIDINERKYTLPRFSPTHMDVFKVECEVPVLLNFYYIDEGALIPELDYGQVVITTLKANKDVSIPFTSNLIAPQITIEVFNPSGNPIVTIHDGQNDFVVNTNKLVRTMPFSSGGVVVKERGGSADTRVIVKLGYNINRWKQYEDSENIIYNEEENIFVFSFPTGEKRYKYKYALLQTSGTNTEDNVKYCYGSNIGNAIVASTDNCYRVSKDNSYTLKIMNPAIMYKDYELDDSLSYYVTLKPLYTTDTFNIKETLEPYSTDYRNTEGVGNVITLTSSATSTILGYPKKNEESVFYQITNCNGPKLNYGIYDALTENQVVSNTDIPENKKNYWNKFDNIFAETELRMTGTSGNKIYIKHQGIGKDYDPKVKDSFPLSFDESNNLIKFTKPINIDNERLTYTVYVAKDGELTKKGLSICSFVEKTDLANFYSRTFSTFKDGYTLAINFNKVGLTKGQKFEAIAYIEQEENSKMLFVTDILSATVGEIKEETITKVETAYSDTNYVYYKQEKKDVETTFYYSFINPTVFDVPVGAFRIELDNDAEGSFSTVYCAWVDEDADAISAVDAVEEIIDVHKPYCIGGVNKNNKLQYNYMFRYMYTSDNKPKKFIIKVPATHANSGFTIYIRKGENTKIKQTEFHTLEPYGNDEQYKMSIIPYIVDLETIRGDDTKSDYVSRVMFYSKNFDMQMYYIDDSGEDIPQNNNAPLLLFTGNVMLVLTKPNLAKQKYFTTKLILLSENIRGQTPEISENSFRFHTKMFRSTDQIEYFVSSEALGRNLNFPLSLEMNTCTSSNNVYYYILNYNYPQEEMNLYLDLIFGSMKSARIATSFGSDTWDDLINKNMKDISDYFVKIPESSTHIDIVEVKCNTPLLINAYYNTDNYDYGLVSTGNVVVRNLEPKESFTFYLDTTMASTFYYSIEVYDPKKNPSIKITFSNGLYNSVSENSLRSGMLIAVPESVNLVNDGSSLTRVIFKVGFGVESGWTPDSKDINGVKYSYNNKFVYKFPAGNNKLNFTEVDISVKPLNKDVENIKFCYSTSIGMPIESSKENCFRTGANIPYTLTFMNPLVFTKNYKRYVDNYYVSLFPQSSSDFIDLIIEEKVYETKDRNVEGASKIINLDTATKGTILSIPELEDHNNIVVQLAACKASIQMISYVNKKALTQDVISTGNVTPREELHYYILENNYMETLLEFSGAVNDQVFVKHTGITDDYDIVYQSYESTFNENSNEVKIIKPIFDEPFTFNVLVGQKGAFDNYNLCTFHQGNIKDLADYVSTFTSNESNEIVHYIDFRSITKNKYEEGQEFDLIVFATQTQNSKLEFVYPIISGKVGHIEYLFTEVEGTLGTNIATQKFVKTGPNYLYYDFTSVPVGSVAALRIQSPEEGSVTVTRTICTFVERETTDYDMQKAVNNAALNNENVCKGQEKKNSNGFDALINAKSYALNTAKSRLLVQIMYGFGDENKETNDIELTINIRTTGFDVAKSDEGYNEDETNVILPYVLDLTKIRGTSTTDYISKVLIYSSKRELEMYHLQSTTPTQLFTGNILLVYTNTEVVIEKYSGATTMILLTESLFKNPVPIVGENFRFKSYFFKSDNTMNYYVSSNPSGRPLNTPIIVDMPTCDKPYYYILNYHYPEEIERMILHIDKIYGEISNKRIATKLNKEDWNALVESMEDMEGNEILLVKSEQDQNHMDVIEASCTIPTLLYFYYVDENGEKIQGVAPGDTSIINLAPGASKTVTLQTANFTYICTFNALKEGTDPKISVSFGEGQPLEINKNGIFNQKLSKSADSFVIKNEEIGGSTYTKIFFKYGYEMETTFKKIENDVYYYTDSSRRLYGYKFSTADDRLNYTNISFLVSPKDKEDNVKFCYTTNFGSYMEPSSQDCYRVGKDNSYTLTILNPYLMYKEYSLGDSVMPYYVSFKTDNPSQSITITPKLNKYNTNFRNLENSANTVSVTKSGSTILTAPSENSQYIFVQMQVCDADREIEYNLLNAYNGTSLNSQGNIRYDDKIYFFSIPNTKLDTELVMTTDTSSKVFVKHTGLDDTYATSVVDINMKFFRDNNTLSFNQPIPEENFKYTIYVDKGNEIKNKNYRLCNFVLKNEQHYSKEVTSADEYVFVKIDFDNEERFKNIEDFDLIIVAEQIDNGKLMILSEVLQAKPGGSSTNRTVLVIVVVVLGIILIAGGIGVYFFLKKYKSKPNSKKIDAKQTSLADVDNPNEKLVMSTATEKND